MKKFFSIYLVSLTIFFLGVVVHVAEAKTVTFSPGTALYPRDGCTGLNGMTYSVLYKANVYNDSAGGVLLNDGDSIPVGTQIRFQDGPYLDSDINWNGTGWYSASPYGVWINEADTPSFDKFANIPYFGIPDYFTLSVEPPQNVTAIHSGTAGLSCDVSGMICTVTSAGSIISQAQFDNRSSQKLYRYDSGCDAGYVTDFTGASLAELAANGYNNYLPGKSVNVWHGNGTFFIGYAVPLTANLDWPINSEVITATNGDPAPYVNDTGIPDQSITFNLTAVSSSNAPTVPVVTGPATGPEGVPQPFAALSTDPDGDTLRYGFDWDNNGSVDQWAPGVGYVPSGTSDSASRTFGTAGSYTFQVLAEDSMGGQSAFTSKSITITPVPVVTFSATPATVPYNTPATLTWSSTDATSCTGPGSLNGAQATSGSASTGNLTSAQTYTITCTGTGGTSLPQSVTVNVNPTKTTSLSPLSQTLTLSNSITFTSTASFSDNSMIEHNLNWRKQGGCWNWDTSCYVTNANATQSNYAFPATGAHNLSTTLIPTETGTYEVQAAAFDGTTWVYSSLATITIGCSAQQGSNCVVTNICSMSNTGTIQCNGTCNAMPPDETLCPVASNCGNGVCEGAGIPAETLITCPADCKVKVRQF